MASRAKQKTTMAKLNRERAVQEKRLQKKMRKDARRQAAAEEAISAESPQPDEAADQVEEPARA
jgi:hypothetical protein